MILTLQVDIERTPKREKGKKNKIPKKKEARRAERRKRKGNGCGYWLLLIS